VLTFQDLTFKLKIYFSTCEFGVPAKFEFKILKVISRWLL